MATVFFAWELGGGLGHVDALLPIATALAAMGHQPIFAVRNLVEPASRFAPHPFPVLQAPFWHPRLWLQPGPFIATNHADILAIHGYSNTTDLYPMVEAWQRLIDLTRSVLIVSDHSPTACLAAYGSLPVVQIGGGFLMPPVDQATFPALVPDQPPLWSQDLLLDTVRQVQHRRGRPCPERLTSFLATTGRFILGWPELDPYRSVRREPHLGPYRHIPYRDRQPQPRHFAAYLAADYPSACAILEKIVQSGWTGDVYLRSAAESQQQGLRAGGLTVHATPPPIHELLERASVVIHHGGQGTAGAALSVGCPQLLLPRHLEQKLTADSLQSLGVARYLSGKVTMAEILESLQELAHSTSAERAAAEARKISPRKSGASLQQIVDFCTTLL